MGIAHEFGHTNQVRPGLKWVGLGEVTNNIHSTWSFYNLESQTGHKRTRLEEEDIAGYTTNFPAVQGNRFGEFIKQTYVNKESYAAGFVVGNAHPEDNNFRALIPFWQLELYYQLAGASKGAPTLAFDADMSDETTAVPAPPAPGVDYAHWHAFVVNRVLNTNETSLTNGQLAMNFVKNVCDAVQENLLDFFTNTGFLTPINATINDYSNAQLTITQAMIDEVKNYVTAKGYAKPASPVMHYISSNSVDIFKNRLPLSGVTGVGAQVMSNSQGRFLEVDNSKWNNAVAFETYDANNKLITVSIVGTGDISLVNTYVHFPTGAAKVYAVGYDGQKILVYPAAAKAEMKGVSTEEVSTVQDHDSFIIYPNPVHDGQNISIRIKNASGNYQSKIYNIAGMIYG